MIICVAILFHNSSNKYNLLKDMVTKLKIPRLDFEIIKLDGAPLVSSDS